MKNTSTIKSKDNPVNLAPNLAKVFDLSKLSQLKLTQVPASGKHIIIGDLHFNPRFFLNGKTDDSSEFRLLTKTLDLIKNENRSVNSLVALTINGDCFDADILETLNDEEKAQAFVNLYGFILKKFESITLYVNAGDHDFPKIVKDQFLANGDDILDLSSKAKLGKVISTSTMIPKQIRVLGMNPRVPIIYQPVLDSSPIAVTHISYDVSSAIKKQLGAQQLKFSKTLGSHPTDVPKLMQPVEVTNNEFKSNAKKIIRVSSDLHVPYGDSEFNIWNTGTLSASRKNGSTPFTFLEIYKGLVKLRAVAYKNLSSVVTPLNCLKELSEQNIQTLLLTDWDPKIERSSVDENTSAAGCR